MLERIQRMQPEAWARLVDVFGPVVYRWCRQSGVAAQDATDIVQDVFSGVVRGIEGFPNG
jgi:RNA polymerase sigma-70 factor (ECF subfamily)